MKWFKDLKIRVKLLLSFSIITIISVIIGYIGIANLNTFVDLSKESYRTGTQGVVYIGNMEDAFQRMRNEVRNLLLAETKEEIDKDFAAVEYFNKDFETNSKSYEGTYVDDNDKKTHEKIKDMYANYYKGAVNLHEFVVANKKTEAKEYMNSTMMRINLELSKTLEESIEFNDKTVSDFNENLLKTSSGAKTLMIIIILVGIIFSAIISLFIASIINNPVRKLEQAAILVSEGNLNIEIDIQTKDELGNLANSFRLLVNNFKNLIKKVIEQTDTINKESDGLLSISNIAASASAELQAQAQTASSSSEQISANVQTVSTSAEEMTSSIKEISKNTTSASSLTRESEDRANNASQVMNRLGKSSQEIGNIVKSITTIAEQTNLLALNATIEAARAGELGKGFAVVANEVKELAKEAAKATEDITSKIKMIQDDSDNAIGVIQGIIDNASKVNEVTNSIASAIEEQSVTTTEINRNLSEAAMGVKSIVEVVSGITTAANDYAKQASTIKSTSGSLKTMSSDLDREIKANFRI